MVYLCSESHTQRVARFLLDIILYKIQSQLSYFGSNDPFLCQPNSHPRTLRASHLELPALPNTRCSGVTTHCGTGGFFPELLAPPSVFTWHIPPEDLMKYSYSVIPLYPNIYCHIYFHSLLLYPVCQTVNSSTSLLVHCLVYNRCLMNK